MEIENENEKGTLCDECREYGFCFRYDKEALQKWHEQRFVLDVNKVKNHIPLKRELGYSFGDKAQKQKKVFQEMYDAFHQEEYQVALNHVSVLKRDYNPDEDCFICEIFCHYFLGNYQFVHDNILERIEHYFTDYRNQLLQEVLLDSKNKLWILQLESELLNIDESEKIPDLALKQSDIKVCATYVDL